MTNIFNDFFSWLKVHKTGREHLFHNSYCDYDWGYIKACVVIETELKRLIQEHKDASDRITGNQGILDEQIPSRNDNVLSTQ